ncbi:unnamed protein product [Blumeria hordei]|uniref:Uncharacterized protein n=1 Tax=Blumeria hordei TaxID=2867405 RepID=A0A383UZB3_BLUHO|nr:unnamed protein product [Blumeria hordei]
MIESPSDSRRTEGNHISLTKANFYLRLQEPMIAQTGSALTGNLLNFGGVRLNLIIHSFKFRRSLANVYQYLSNCLKKSHG